MKFKEKWKQFWTLQRHEKGGFSLIELVVVIAIMGILAAGGVSAYSGYVKNAAAKADKVLVGNVIRVLDTANNSRVIPFAVEGQYSEGLQIPVGFVVISNEPYDDDTHTKIISSNDATNALDVALTSAFGSDYAKTLKLESSKWDKVSYAYFFTQAGPMITKIQTMGTKILDMFDDLGSLYDGNGGVKVDLGFFGGVKQFKLLSQDYDTSDQMLAATAAAIAGVDRDVFIEDWATLTQEQNPSGFHLAGREYYSAARAAYSQCFSDYVRNANDHSHASSHASSLADNGQNSGDLIVNNLNLGGLGGFAKPVINAATDNLKFPLAVGADTFAAESDRSSDPSDFKKCSECYALWEDYHDSEQARIDAAAFYDMMVTATTYESENENDAADGLLAWAGEQTDLFEDMYGDLRDYTSDRCAIAVAVYHDTTTDRLNIDVLPEGADPRND